MPPQRSNRSRCHRTRSSGVNRGAITVGHQAEPRRSPPMCYSRHSNTPNGPGQRPGRSSVVLTGPRSRLRSPYSLEEARPAVAVARTASPALRQRQRRLNNHEVVVLVQQYRAGHDMADLAASFGIHRVTVARQLRKMATPLRGQGLSPEQLAKPLVCSPRGGRSPSSASGMTAISRRCIRRSRGLGYRGGRVGNDRARRRGLCCLCRPSGFVRRTRASPRLFRAPAVRDCRAGMRACNVRCRSAGAGANTGPADVELTVGARVVI